MKKIIRIATRPSLLATTQTQWVVDRLKNKNPEIDFKIITYSTQGDRDTSRSLTSFGNTGLFVKELEHALLNNEADIAVHSLKDVPSDQPAGLLLASFPKREMPHDVLLTKDNVPLDRLPYNAIVGTGSPRRVLQLAMIRPDLQFKEIRGNIDTRINKLSTSEYDAIVLAAAGLRRLEKHFPVFSILETSEMIPAIGQGILALETKADNADAITVAQTINDEATMHEAIAERIFMKTIEGGCKFPLAAYTKFSGNGLSINAIIGDIKTYKYIRKRMALTLDEYPDVIKRFALEMKTLAKQEKINLNFES